MMVIFSLILALVLLVGIIYALRHHYERTRHDAVAREQPLPPLAADTRPAVSKNATESIIPPTHEVAVAVTQEGAEDKAQKENAQEETSVKSPEHAPTSQTIDWRQNCQALRNQRQFEDALSVCRQAWPQWQSFDQAARVMRAAIRKGSRDSADQHQWLHRLYILAAQASFLHDKVDGLPDPIRQDLTQRFTPRQLDELDMPWLRLGCDQMRLLTKSDRKQLIQLWGEPTAHQSARKFHAKQWLTTIP